ncbi:MAG: sirohydrochlorin cobaltochelatase [Syntrophobacteraceae bacterium]
MPKIWLSLVILLAICLLFSLNCDASEKRKKPQKQAILLVAFGTSVPEARKAFDAIQARAETTFPGVEVRWAFTSKTIRSRSAAEGKPLDSPETALAKLMDDGCTHVAILSLHVIPGVEFHELQRNVRLFEEMAGGFECVTVARPLLSSSRDLRRASEALIGRIPRERKPEDAVIFMGHGSEKHPSDAMYAAMHGILQDLDSNVHMATVDGYPSIEDILPKLEAKKVRKVWLMPFMTVAGVHAREDMAGDKPDSWRSILAGKGITCSPVLTGLAEYPEFVDIWLEHLKDAFPPHR